MTIGFSTIDTAIRTAVLACVSGITTDVGWDYESPKMRTATRITLKRTPMASIGMDGSIYRDAEADLHEYRHGQRSFRVEVRAETILGSGRAAASDPVSADDILARVVTRIRRKTNTEALATAGCGITDLSGIVRTTYSADGTRDTRAAILTIGFLAGDLDRVTEVGASEDFITDVEGTINDDPFAAP